MNEPGAPVVFKGFPAAEGIARGRVRTVDWHVPAVPRVAVPEGGRSRELERFRGALARARTELEGIKGETGSRLGPIEARIFDPQILMLDDPEVVLGTERYISDNRLTAARAFDWRMLELKDRWSRTSHPMVLDRLNDLEDLKVRVLRRLLDLPDPWEIGGDAEPGGIVAVAKDLTPSFVASLDASRVVGLATDEGTRTSHWAILARSLEIPAAAGLGDIAARAGDGQPIIVDGWSGRVVIEPDAREVDRFERRRATIRGWRRETPAIAREEAVTLDRKGVTLRANLDLPGEAARARALGARGVGLFRTEFLVVGRNTVPREEEQYLAYRSVAETFSSHPVLIRTFDLGGDKFPVFLRTPAEDNPFLGRRGVRVCPDEPELFLTQFRAMLRAAVHGDLRIMAPLVNTGAEIATVRELLGMAENQLRSEGVPFARAVEVGAMIETPAAALAAPGLAAHADFFSIGTNDLVQYTLAVDRTNTRLAHLYDPFHPAVLRQISMVARAGRAAGVEVSACGEMATRPLGVLLLLGLGVEVLSVAWRSLPGIKRIVRNCRLDEIRAAAEVSLEAPTGAEARRSFAASLRPTLNRVFPPGA
ncbi:MAG: phosphoenolpyruvate--protein phosphotransferase [Gemmatimonadetes bacterium]|nr:phosphoenolpyruvate--protein phosphotransferase [Gemmatimonadota bacterium]MYA65264.1 phosphoenolpyruvate--protein phosphotransferase [Gemmatimonadota bacterium]MYB99788.1 phosphoenolpyruvate--protein phosphotransferase [Gemmatimonadota bacterium]MYH53655.1 phosphoenolpyruvate--protein phosphotransferase [Gemmatimonadota bacterium]MYI45016.1 phosphoenolpyruvate--protein phosphotransferase [Gemmatimonadota bacterium]